MSGFLFLNVISALEGTLLDLFVCATCNTYRPPLLLDRERGDLMAKRMFAISKTPNLLKQIVEEYCWNKRVKSQWKPSTRQTCHVLLN